jgi:hypothetical protein
MLGSALNAGTLSPEKYIDLLWGDSLGEVEKIRELEFVKSSRQQETSMMDELGSEEMMNDIDGFDGQEE